MYLTHFLFLLSNVVTETWTETFCVTYKRNQGITLYKLEHVLIVIRFNQNIRDRMLLLSSGSTIVFGILILESKRLSKVLNFFVC